MVYTGKLYRYKLWDDFNIYCMFINELVTEKTSTPDPSKTHYSENTLNIDQTHTHRHTNI